MPTKTQQNVTVRAGETRPILISILDEEGNAVDVSNDILIYRIARHNRRTSYIVDIDQDDPRLVVSDNGAGTHSYVTYTPGLNDLTLPGRHVHALAIIKSGNDARVAMVGQFTILDAITHPA